MISGPRILQPREGFNPSERGLAAWGGPRRSAASRIASMVSLKKMRCSGVGPKKTTRFRSRKSATKRANASASSCGQSEMERGLDVAGSRGMAGVGLEADRQQGVIGRARAAGHISFRTRELWPVGAVGPSRRRQTRQEGGGGQRTRRPSSMLPEGSSVICAMIGTLRPAASSRSRAKDSATEARAGSCAVSARISQSRSRLAQRQGLPRGRSTPAQNGAHGGQVGVADEGKEEAPTGPNEPATF